MTERQAIEQVRRLQTSVPGPRSAELQARRLAARQRHLPRAWQARRALFVGRPFSIDRGEMTHSMKLKRRTVATRFGAELEAASAAVAAGDWAAITALAQATLTLRG